MPQTPLLIDPTPDALLARLESLGIRLGLEATARLLAELGDPQLRFPAVLIAGSNGKGSTSSLLAAMGHAAGYRTGLYTSPHLEKVEERLRIDGRVIRSARLTEILQRVVSRSEQAAGEPPTYFEALTVAAFVWFAEEQVDLAVVEVGMGGRLDATNLCDPLLSIITSISLEHCEHLGNTLTAIAREKAGVLRAGRPALTSTEAPEAAAAIRVAADALGAELHEVASEVQVEESESLGWSGQRLALKTALGSYDLRLALLGEHQIRNACLAVRAAETLRAGGWSGFDPAAIAQGAAASRWPGRLEVVELPNGRRVLLDAAHNPEGAETLARFLGAAVEAPVGLLFGVLEDKDVDAMLGPLIATGRIGDVVLTRPHSPRARPPQELLAALPSGERRVEVEPDLGRALDRVIALGAETVLVCGSIYLVGALREELRRRWDVPAAATAPLDLVAGTPPASPGAG